MAAAPMPSVFSAGLSWPSNSRIETAEFSPDMPKWMGRVADILVPHGNDGGADEDAGVVGEWQAG